MRNGKSFGKQMENLMTFAIYQYKISSNSGKRIKVIRGSIMLVTILPHFPTGEHYVYWCVQLMDSYMKL